LREKEIPERPDDVLGMASVTGWLKMYAHRRFEKGVDKQVGKGAVSLPQSPSDDTRVGDR
jgi:hypothetical protein